jgi:hypothetical protein
MQGATVFSIKPRAQISGFYDRDKELKQIQGVIGIDNGYLYRAKDGRKDKPPPRNLRFLCEKKQD